jgi:serine/threonine-protein kinase BUR1
MFKRKPILTGSSDLNQLQIIFDLVGSPTDDNMPGWSRLPGCDGVKEFAPRTGNLPQAFREYVLKVPPSILYGHLSLPLHHRQGSSAISLLSDLLRLDWRKRINAIDALKHPYFRTAPLPARPGELPRFEDSHELDRRKFRAQKQNPPPAPQGGQVGMGPEGQWAAGPGPRPGGREAMDPRQGRVGPGAYVNGTGNQNFGPRKGHESRIPDSHRQTSQEPPSHRPWARDDGLPPRPPPTTNQPWNNPPWEGGRNNNNDRRDRGPPPSRNDRAPGTGGPGGAGPKKDTYIPSYSNASERPRPPPRDDGVRRDDRPTSRGRYDGPRDQDDRAYMRRRSRSPRDRSHDDRREYRR